MVTQQGEPNLARARALSREYLSAHIHPRNSPRFPLSVHLLYLTRFTAIPRVLASVKYPTVEELIELNLLVLRELPVKRADKHEVRSKVALGQVLEEAKNEPGDIYDKAAVLLIGIVKKHPFASGTRRTAIAAAISFLRLNGEHVHTVLDPKVLQGVRALGRN